MISRFHQLGGYAVFALLATAAPSPRPRTGPGSTQLVLATQHNSPNELPLLKLPVQIGNVGTTTDVTFTDGYSDCIVSTGGYDPQTSPTAVDLKHNFTLQVAHTWHGKTYTDTVKVGALSIPSFPIGSIPAPTSFGTCGIAWDSPSANLSVTGQGPSYKSFVYAFKAAGAAAKALISISYNLNSQPMLSLGASITAVASDHWVKVDTQAPGTWRVPGSVAGVNTKVIVTPGEAMIWATMDDATKIINAIGLTPRLNNNKYVTSNFPCADVPDVNIVIGGLAINLTTDVLTYQKDDDGSCVLPIYGLPGYKEEPILGSTFLASIKEVVFDFEQLALGIVPF
ncbi:hypothetical protein OC834_007595 [Tilletia horrida]|uniref:Peptidase A1 domain-containing protein n=1 Tax=Tilletia horrida TaxID=155126 RepID=A0AAN6G4V9_9BASI|nr:hypothetical protein OC842_007747 [Tilletia horrida]KAK0518814.1 hypothetical protein OC834_007595 [Tilletia horrida]